MSRSFALAIAALWLVVGAGVASAQDAAVIQTYGAGVHAFFDGDYSQAHELMTKAIDAEMGDPRPYYYRGLVYLRTGRSEEASADFESAADLELSNLNRLYRVSLALERIQGDERMTIERHRAKARLAAHARDQEFKRERYSELRRREAQFIADQANDAPATAVDLSTTTPAPATSTLIDVFGDGSTARADTTATDMPATAGTEEPAVDLSDVPPADATDTVSTPPMPAATTTDSPFGGTVPATTDSPFGGSVPATTDSPFGGSVDMSTPPAPAAGDVQTADDPGAILGAFSNLFGGSTGAAFPATDMPEEMESFGGSSPAPVDDTDSPFGMEAPATDSDDAADSPFGGSDSSNPFGDNPFE